MIVKTTQIVFGRGYIEAATEGGPMGEGVDVHIVADGTVLNLGLSGDEAREFAQHLLTTADRTDTIMAAKNRAFEEAREAALKEGKSDDEADQIAGDVAEQVKVPA